jgi:hypothetical protein
LTTQLIGSSTTPDIAGGSGYIRWTKFVASASGTLTAIKAYALANDNFRVAIYSDNSGPDSLLSESNSTAVTSGQWNTISLGTSVSLTNGTAYWLAEQNQANNSSGYRSAAGVLYRYKAVAYGAFPNPASGYSSADNNELGIQGWGTVLANVTVDAPCPNTSITALAPTVTGSAVSTPPTATMAAAAPSPSVSTGVNATSSPPVATVACAALAPSVATTKSVTSSPPVATVAAAAPAPTVFLGTTVTISAPVATASVQAFTVVAGPLTGVTVAAPCALASSQAYTVSTTVLFHVILEAEYLQEAPDVNRAYVIGQDAAGSLVSGSAITQGDVDLCGERMEAQHDPAIATAAAAASVAGAVLAKSRLDGKRGKITIPPHCGLELWDVVRIDDEGCNLSGDYRVTGY